MENNATVANPTEPFIQPSKEVFTNGIEEIQSLISFRESLLGMAFRFSNLTSKNKWQLECDRLTVKINEFMQNQISS